MILALTRVRPYKSKAYCCDKKTIFETKKAPYFSSLYDIEDLMISSTGMKYEHKKEYFECHGLDLEYVDKYYDIVKSLNTTLYKNKVDNEHIFPWIFKLFLFYLSIITS